MSDVLKQIYNACDPNKPATAEYYLDCSEARGEGALTQRFRAHLLRASAPCCFLFSGHIGCGKSSELAEMKRALSQPNPEEPHARYFPILLDANEYLDVYDVAPSDILLAIATEVAATLRKDLGVELQESHLFKRFEELKDYLLRDVDVSEAEAEGGGGMEIGGFKLPLPKLKLKIQLLRKDPTAHKTVRDALQKRTSTLLEEINLILDEARLRVKQFSPPIGEQHYTDIVLILDNLEKIEHFEEKAAGLEAQRELFLQRYAQLNSFGSHVIYTVPLRLARADGPELKRLYGAAPSVLPMVKVIERGSRAEYKPGVERLRTLLQKRLGMVPLEEAFAPDALDFLLQYSGGHMRDLMSFVRESVTYVEALPITLRDAQRAIQQTVRLYSTAVPESHWKKLAALDLSMDQKIANDDQEYLAMLENLSVLEYFNGGSQDDPFTPAEPWYAVNPIVRELQKFKAARATALREAHSG